MASFGTEIIFNLIQSVRLENITIRRLMDVIILLANVEPYCNQTTAAFRCKILTRLASWSLVLGRNVN